jgi:phytol kinase
MLHNNLAALIVTFLLAVAWLRLNDFAAHRGWISSHLSRKIIHAGTGPLFVVCWLLFDEAASARFLASLVPLTITAQFLLVGLGIIQDEAAVRAMSRSGDRREILRGPLYYGVIFVLLTIWFWRDSPTGMVALMLMCGGDGLADVVGRRFGKQARLPWNPNKSWAGSVGMLSGGWLFSLIIMAIFIRAGQFSGSLASYLPALTIIALAGTLVESLPLRDVDNLTVTACAVIFGYWLF